MEFNEVSTDYWVTIVHNYEQTYGISSHEFYDRTRQGEIVVDDANVESEWITLHEWLYKKGCE